MAVLLSEVDGCGMQDAMDSILLLPNGLKILSW